MAKKSVVARQKKRELLVAKNWEKRTQLRKMAVDLSLSEEDRQKARTSLNKMRRDTSPSRLKNRCQFTGRSRGFLRKFRMSRLCFREKALAGFLPGITKSSW
jgi:small subunit ribosomal protein S14